MQQVTQVGIQMSLEYIHRRRLHNLSGQQIAELYSFLYWPPWNYFKIKWKDWEGWGLLWLAWAGLPWAVLTMLTVYTDRAWGFPFLNSNAGVGEACCCVGLLLSICSISCRSHKKLYCEENWFILYFTYFHKYIFTATMLYQDVLLLNFIIAD